MNKILWHNIAIKEISQLLKVDLENGLNTDEVKRRQEKYGLNKLPEEKRLAWFFVLLNQFKSPLIYILLLAAFISFVLGEIVDTWVILIAVFINTVVGFIQENKAEKTLEHLKKIINFKSEVFRDGEEISLDSSKVTVGDILLLEAGSRVPADGRIFELNDFQVNEAALTGESLPVNKELGELDKGANLGDRKNMVFMGTTVTRGRAKVIVTGIGKQTNLGEIAELVKETEDEKTPLQLQLAQFSKWIGTIVIVICFFLFIFGVLLGYEVFEMFETSVAVAVAAIPEGLIVSVTIILTVGMQRILRKKALVRKLIAAETLGSISVICSDKTGTLTEGVMRVGYLLTGHCDFQKDLLRFEQQKFNDKLSDHYLLLSAGVICNNTILSKIEGSPEEEFIGDPTETALLKAGIDAGLDYKKIRQEEKRLAELPFSTETKYMATLNENHGQGNMVYLKGAPEKVLDFCSQIQINGARKELARESRKIVLANFDKLTSQGLRVLAVACKSVDKNQKTLGESDMKDLVFLGVYALKDPLRKEARATIHLCKDAGIRPIIITGDHRLTVKAIVEEIGLDVRDENILEGSDLDKLSDEELNKIVKNIKIYARVSPKHKLRIVDAWQAHGEVVAMIGDGVNDAPALKTSDIGVALGSGTDVAKETAEVILLDNNFKTIVEAVRQGRIIFDNIRKVIVYLLADSFSEIILIVGSLIARLPLPLTALQILYINIIDDGFPNIALTFEPGEKEIMDQKPRKKNEPILNKQMKYIIFIIGVVTDLLLFGLYFYLLHKGYPIGHIRTMIFTALALDSLLYVFSVKSLNKNIWQINLFNNKYLLLAVMFGLFLQFAALYLPFMRNVLELTLLNYFEWSIILCLSMIKITGIETIKFIFIHARK